MQQEMRHTKETLVGRSRRAFNECRALEHQASADLDFSRRIEEAAVVGAGWDLERIRGGVRRALSLVSRQVRRSRTRQLVCRRAQAIDVLGVGDVNNVGINCRGEGRASW